MTTLSMEDLVKRSMASWLAVLLSLAFGVGCTTPAAEEPEPSEAYGDAATAVNAFAFSLMGELDSGENQVFSPFSIATTLAMVSAGTRGPTQEEFHEVLFFDADAANIHDAYGDLISQVVMDGGEEGPTVLVANSLWVQMGMSYGIDFLNTLEESYGSEMREVDYISDAEGARGLINQWVAAQTRDLIDELLPRGILSNLTRLVAVNALYVKASWQVPFEESDTRDEPFTTAAGTTVEVPMMRREGSMRYLKNSRFEAVELGYEGADLILLMVAPQRQRVPEFLTGLTAASFAELREELDSGQVRLGLPRFSLDVPTGLRESLIDLGLERAFDAETADFTPISRDEDLFLHDVVHQATFDVDEKGTEAAAATAAIIGIESMPDPDAFEDITFDEPFAFFLIDGGSGAILFLGQVLDPS